MLVQAISECGYVTPTPIQCKAIPEVLAGRADGAPLRIAMLLAIVAVVLALCLLVFVLASRIAGFIGVTGNVVLSRLLGVILAALAVQYVIDGVRAALGG